MIFSFFSLFHIKTFIIIFIFYNFFLFCILLLFSIEYCIYENFIFSFFFKSPKFFF